MYGNRGFLLGVPVLMACPAGFAWGTLSTCTNPSGSTPPAGVQRGFDSSGKNG